MSEIEELKAQITELEAKVGQLQHFYPRKVLPNPTPVERGVTISTPAPVSTFVMPTDDELTKLIDAVARRYPALVDATSTAWVENFEECFFAIGNMKRTPETDHKVYLSFHTSVAQSILVGLGRSRMTLRGDCFLAAALSHYDVAVSGIGRTHEGICPEVGLAEYVGRPATDAWRRIIEGAAPRECAVQNPPPAPSQSSVRYY